MATLSIITVCYNDRSGLEKTINSVIQQSFKDFEYIVIDGGSTDGSVEILDRYKKFINYQISEKDEGTYHAMNKGIEKANGEYCIFMNSDDRFAYKNTLLKVFINHPDTDILYGNVIRVKSWWNRWLIKYPENLTILDFNKRTATVHHQATFINRDLFDRFGDYRTDLKLISDWEFFFRTIIKNSCSTRYLDEIIAVVDGTGKSHKYSMDDPDIIYDLKIRDNILRNYIPADKFEELDRLKNVNANVLTKLFNKIKSILRF